MPRTLSPENVLAPKSWPQYHPTHLHGTRLFDAKVGTKLNYHFNLYVFFYFYPIETTSLVLTSEKGLTPLSLFKSGCFINWFCSKIGFQNYFLFIGWSLRLGWNFTFEMGQIPLSSTSLFTHPIDVALNVIVKLTKQGILSTYFNLFSFLLDLEFRMKP